MAMVSCVVQGRQEPEQIAQLPILLHPEQGTADSLLKVMLGGLQMLLEMMNSSQIEMMLLKLLEMMNIFQMEKMDCTLLLRIKMLLLHQLLQTVLLLMLLQMFPVIWAWRLMNT